MKRTLALFLALSAASAFAQPRDRAFMTAAPRATKRHIIDRKFLALAAAEVAADAGDIITRQAVQCSNPTSHEVNPLLGPYPTAARMALTQLPFTVAANITAYEMKKSHRFHRVWWIPFALSLGGSAWGIQSNVAHLHVEGGN